MFVNEVEKYEKKLAHEKKIALVEMLCEEELQEPIYNWSGVARVLSENGVFITGCDLEAEEKENYIYIDMLSEIRQRRRAKINR